LNRGASRPARDPPEIKEPKPRKITRTLNLELLLAQAFCLTLREAPSLSFRVLRGLICFSVCSVLFWLA
jgi:hypothetical protein